MTESIIDTQKHVDALIGRFTSRHGRNPTEDEREQLTNHGHIHEHFDHPGTFASDCPVDATNGGKKKRTDLTKRAFTIGIGGPVGSGKTALTLQLCLALSPTYGLAVVTNDIFTKEDGEFLIKHKALDDATRIMPIETGGCPHAAIREDISANLQACETLTQKHQPHMILVESGGDNLAANFSRELADYIIYVIDVSGGDKIPRKGGPGITQADLLVINKVDLAEAVGADLSVMDRDSKMMRGEGPVVFSIIKNGKQGLDEIKDHILTAWKDFQT